MEIKTNTIATMKKLLFLFILMLSPMLASAQTVSDVQNSGCLKETRGEDSGRVPTIVLTKEGSVLSVQLLNYKSDCCTSDFNVTSNINGGSDGDPCSINISVVPVEGFCDCMCPYNVSFIIRDLEPNSFYLNCWWYKGQVELTEEEPLVLEDIYEDVTIDGINFTLRKAFHQAKLTKSEWVGEVRIPSELSYGGQTYSVTSMYNAAFMDNTTLTKVYIPRSIKSMDFREEGGLYWNPFYKCSALESIEVEDGNPMFSTVDGVLFNKEKTKIYCYPAADSRTSYTLPENVTSLGDFAFSGCKLESLYIRGTIDFHRTDDYRSFGDMGTQTKVYVQPSQVDQFKALYKGPVYPLPEQTAYYYYNGNKISLTLNEKKVIVSIPKDCDGTRQRISAYVQILSTVKDKDFDIFVIPRSDFEKLASQDFWEEDAKSVVLTSCYFTANKEEIYETPYLNVRLKKEEDVKLLDSYAEKYKLRNHGSFSQYLPLWYILNVTPESDKSPLQCANELYESGDFAASVADLADAAIPKDDYRPFVEEGKVWKVGTISGNPVQVVDYYYFDGDTIIGGKTCKQMMCQRYVSPDYPNEYWTPTPSLSKVGAWYEEDQKVYFYDEIIQSMKMMYDFSLGDYETVDFLNVDGYPPYIIGPRQTGGIKGFKGVYRDIMMGQDINTKTPWLEGVGGLDGPFASVYDPLADYKPEFLMA